LKKLLARKESVKTEINKSRHHRTNANQQELIEIRTGFENGYVSFAEKMKSVMRANGSMGFCSLDHVVSLSDTKKSGVVLERR